MFFHKKTDRLVKTLRNPLTIYIVVRVILLQIIYNSLLSQCRKSIHIGQQDDFHDEEERWLVSFSRKNQTCLLVRDNSRLVKAVLVKKMLCVFSGPVSYMFCQLKIWDRLVWCSFLSKNSTELMKNVLNKTSVISVHLSVFLVIFHHFWLQYRNFCAASGHFFTFFAGNNGI